MKHQSAVSLAVVVAVGVATVVTFSNEASARGGRGGAARHVGGHHGGMHHHHAYRAPVRRGVAVGVGAAAAGAAAGAYYYGQQPQCGYSGYPPCY